MYKVFRGGLLSIYALLILIPCMIVITGAFKTDFEIYTKPLSLPTIWSFENFVGYLLKAISQYRLLIVLLFLSFP